MHTTVVLDRRCRAHYARRSGLVFDSRFCARLPASDRVTLMMSTEGQFQPADADVVSEPSLWSLTDGELEGVPPSARTLRSWGEPAVVVSLWLDRDLVRVPVGLDEGPRPLSPAVRAAIPRLHGGDDPPGDRDAQRRAYLAILEALTEEEVIARDVLDESEVDEPAQLERLWSALAELYAKQDTGTTIDLLSVLAATSPRQIYRDARELLERFELAGSFRQHVRVLRLRRAAMLLSAPTLSIDEVARTVGYGGSDAMARAFRDAGLPAPSVIRAALAV